MCGIAGMIDWRAATSADALRSIGEAMNDTLRHRGPDGSGVWVEAEGGAALCQRRLAIIDLSPRRRAADALGRSAATSSPSTARSTITATSAASSLRPGRQLRGDSDTEVLLEACALWGVEAAIERAHRHVRLGPVGPQHADACTSCATASASSRSTTLATAERVLFASELKAFRAVPGWKPTIDRDAVAGLPAARLRRRSRAPSIARPRSCRPAISSRCALASRQRRSATGTCAASPWRARRATTRRRTRTRRSNGSMRCCAIRSGCG